MSLRVCSASASNAMTPVIKYPAIFNATTRVYAPKAIFRLRISSDSLMSSLKLHLHGNHLVNFEVALPAVVLPAGSPQPEWAGAHSVDPVSG